MFDYTKGGQEITAPPYSIFYPVIDDWNYIVPILLNHPIFAAKLHHQAFPSEHFLNNL